MDCLHSNGGTVATILSGIWRRFPPKLEIPAAKVASAAPLLLKSGAGALGWWRVRHLSPETLSFSLRRLYITYLRYAVQAAEYEAEIGNVFSALRSSGIEPILIKGWAIARVYPEAGLRPCGDIDLCISPDQYSRARAVLSRRDPYLHSVDLSHDTIARFSEFSFEELYARSQVVNLGRPEIRVLGAEDHLRILCLHMLKHGAWRPLWLCDVAAALESRPSNFDWDLCLGKNERRADWILSSLALANRLLGAATEGTPAFERTRKLPRWLARAVLKQWNATPRSNLPAFLEQVAGRWWTAGTVRAIHQRWPNPIQATVDAGGAFTATTRLPYQIRDCALRAVELAASLRSTN